MRDILLTERNDLFGDPEFHLVDLNTMQTKNLHLMLDYFFEIEMGCIKAFYEGEEGLNPTRGIQTYTNLLEKIKMQLEVLEMYEEKCSKQLDEKVAA